MTKFTYEDNCFSNFFTCAEKAIQLAQDFYNVAFEFNSTLVIMEKTDDTETLWKQFSSKN